MIFIFLLLLWLPLGLLGEDCRPFYVRWQRVRLNVKHVSSARLSLKACESACSLSEDPQVPGRSLECSAVNHHSDVNGYSHVCEVFQPHQLQNVDGYVEADDRYSFYWKFCLNSTRRCGGDYAFTYLSDRYMESAEVIKSLKKDTLEECLADCLEEKQFPCRSISFNRTDGGCHLSANNQLTKPASVRLNNNPNFRIDYYENNCYNLSETFQFEQVCHDDGIEVSVKSKFPYTGAMYGLYDFFTCRIEPKEQDHFKYKFPSPMLSKNCSDSIRLKGDEMILQVVLSTDGVEPLYFITPDDLTYEAKCPIHKKNSSISAKPTQVEQTKNKDMDASARALFSALAKENPIPIPHKAQKDTFPLPLTTPRVIQTTAATTTTTVKPTTTTTKAPTTTTTRLTSTTKASTTTKAPTTTTKAPTTTSTTAVPSTQKTPVSSTSTTTMQVKGFLEDEGEIQANRILGQMDGKVQEESKDDQVPEGNSSQSENMGVPEIENESEKNLEFKQNETEITVKNNERTNEKGPTTIAIGIPQEVTVANIPDETTISSIEEVTDDPLEMSQMELDTVVQLRELMTKEKIQSMSEKSGNSENSFINPIMKLFRSQQMMEELADLTKMEDELRKAVSDSQLAANTSASSVEAEENQKPILEVPKASLEPLDDAVATKAEDTPDTPSTPSAPKTPAGTSSTVPVKVSDEEESTTVAATVEMSELVIVNQTLTEEAKSLNDSKELRYENTTAPGSVQATTVAVKEPIEGNQKAKKDTVTALINDTNTKMGKSPVANSDQPLVRREKAVDEEEEIQDLEEEQTFERIREIGRQVENDRNTANAPSTQEALSTQNTQTVRSARALQPAPGTHKAPVPEKESSKPKSLISRKPIKIESAASKTRKPASTEKTSSIPKTQNTQKKPSKIPSAKPVHPKNEKDKQLRSPTSERLPIPRDENQAEVKTVLAKKKATEAKEVLDNGAVKNEFKKNSKITFREPVKENTKIFKTRVSETKEPVPSHNAKLPVAPKAAATEAAPQQSELRPSKEPVMDRLTSLFDKGISMQETMENNLVNLQELEEFIGSGPEGETTVTSIQPASTPAVVAVPQPPKKFRIPSQSSSRRTLRVKEKERIPLTRTNQRREKPLSQATVTNKLVINKQARRPANRGKIQTKPARKQGPVQKGPVANRQKTGSRPKPPARKLISPKTQNRSQKLRREPIKGKSVNQSKNTKPLAKEILPLSDKFLKSGSTALKQRHGSKPSSNRAPSKQVTTIEVTTSSPSSNETLPEALPSKLASVNSTRPLPVVQNRSALKIGHKLPLSPVTPVKQANSKNLSKNPGAPKKTGNVPVAKVTGPVPKTLATGTKVVKKGAPVKVPPKDTKSKGNKPVVAKKSSSLFRPGVKPVIPKPVNNSKAIPKSSVKKAAPVVPKTGKRQPIAPSRRRAAAFAGRLPVDREKLALFAPGGQQHHRDEFRREIVERKVEEFRNMGLETSMKPIETEIINEVDAPIRDIDGELMAKIQQIEQVIMRNETTMRKLNRKTRQLTQENNHRTPTTTGAKTTTTVQAATTQRQIKPPAPEKTASTVGADKKVAAPPAENREVKNPVSFDIYKDGRPVEAVVVGSKISLSFTPQYPIPPEYMSVRGCQVEPIDPKYEWEKEPLPIIKDACPADLVGLVCPPRKTEFGVQISVESFRYQTTPQVQYSCLVRICPFAACPQATCLSVDGCPSDSRRRRGLSLDQIREALEQDPNLARQFGINPSMLTTRPAHTMEQQLMALGGDHVVKRRLVVVNSEDQLRYYVNTGDLP